MECPLIKQNQLEKHTRQNKNINFLLVDCKSAGIKKPAIAGLNFIFLRIYFPTTLYWTTPFSVSCSR